MALLNRSTSKLVLAAAISLLAGCAIYDALRGGSAKFGFSHRVHVDGEGLDCESCHAPVEGADRLALPAQAACNLCHAEIDAEKAPERTVDALFAGGAFRATNALFVDAEVKFSHTQHVAAEVACDACHAGITTNERVDELAPVAMAACSACHVERKLANECSTCHTRLAPDVAPRSHEGNWLKAHGPCVRDKSGTTAERCELCHSESSCTSCHFERAPENHNGHWRLRGHAIVASMDRESCATCHQSDSCDSCHSTAKPKSHTASFGAPLDRHCTSCHFPLRDETCSTCHVATPSHALATPKPPTHNSGMNCRMCHGNGQPLPHVDNGDDCNYCHQ